MKMNLFLINNDHNLFTSHFHLVRQSLIQIIFHYENFHGDQKNIFSSPFSCHSLTRFHMYSHQYFSTFL
jgi:hypothetical protein